MNKGASSPDKLIIVVVLAACQGRSFPTSNTLPEIEPALLHSTSEFHDLVVGVQSVKDQHSFVEQLARPSQVLDTLQGLEEPLVYH